MLQEVAVACLDKRTDHAPVGVAQNAVICTQQPSELYSAVRSAEKLMLSIFFHSSLHFVSCKEAVNCHERAWSNGNCNHLEATLLPSAPRTAPVQN